MENSSSYDPFCVLGLNQTCDEETARQHYLELVKKFPPDAAPERFREIQTAYEFIKDPVALADHLLSQIVRGPKPWAEVVERQKLRPPRFSTNVLLSLGDYRVDQHPGGNE